MARLRSAAQSRRLGGRLDGTVDSFDLISFELGSESVANPEVRVDVAPGRRDGAQLLAELANEHVDRAVAVRHRVAPHPFVDLLAAQHAIGLREQLQDLELARGELEALLADVGLVEVGTDRDLADRRGDVDLGQLLPAVAADGAPRSRRSAPPDDTAWSSRRRRRAAGLVRAAPPTTGRCKRSPPDRAGARTPARGSPSFRGRSPARSSTSAFSRMATSVSTVAGLDSGAVIASERPEPVGEDLHEAWVAVDHRHPEPGLGALRGRSGPRGARRCRHATWEGL